MNVFVAEFTIDDISFNVLMFLPFILTAPFRNNVSCCLNHIIPASGAWQNITTSMIQFLAIMEINTDSLEAIGCDGTQVNTGRKGGVIRLPQ